MHNHSDILTGTHARYITHTKKAKNAKFIRITCLFFLMLCITVGLSHIVTLISIFFCHFGQIFAVCCCNICAVCEARTNYQHKQCFFCMHNKNNIHWTNTKKVIFHKHTKQTCFQARERKRRRIFTTFPKHRAIRE